MWILDPGSWILDPGSWTLDPDPLAHFFAHEDTSQTGMLAALGEGARLEL